MRCPLAVAGRGITQGRRKIVASEQSNLARKMGNVPVSLFFLKKTRFFQKISRSAALLKNLGFLFAENPAHIR
jgi:hypothetical protein